MEAKLKEYRATRRRKELIDNAKNKFEKSKEKLVNLFVPQIIRDMARVRDEEEVLLMENEEEPKPKVEPVKHLIQPVEEFDMSDIDAVSEANGVEKFDENEIPPCGYCLFRYFQCFFIWLALWGFFLYIQFGAVYFIISLLIFIYFNTRTGPRKRGEVSAYSVFNKNCVSIDGTLKPEQFEREIRYGVGTVGSL